MTRLIGGVLAFGSAVAVALSAAVPADAHGTTERVSVGPGGAEADSYSFDPTISADGRFVAFASYAANLIPGDTADTLDVFVRDRRRGTTERVSVGLGGAQGGGTSPSISAHGRFVAFGSGATNLVKGDECRGAIFVRDRARHVTECVSHGLGGAQADNAGYQPAISAGGRFVIFESRAGNLVPGDTNESADVFIHDRQTGTTERASLGQGGVEADGQAFVGRISSGGRFITFVSAADNLVQGDTNGRLDVFVRDRWAGTTRRVSVGPGGVEGNASSVGGAMSAGGGIVAFDSDATNLVQQDTNGWVDAFVRDRRTGPTRRVSLGLGGAQGNGGGWRPSISADGHFVAFTADSTNLVPNDTNHAWDVFVRDRVTGTTRRVSVGQDGVEGNGYSEAPEISADGRVVAFTSDATNLVPGDANGYGDIFVRVLAP